MSMQYNHTFSMIAYRTGRIPWAYKARTKRAGRKVPALSTDS